MDKKDGVLNLIDYKTGGMPVVPNSVEDLFVPQENRASHVFQIFLYTFIQRRNQPTVPVVPQLLYINKAGSEEYSTRIEIGSRNAKMVVSDFSSYESVFKEHLSALIAGLFDPKQPFNQTNELTCCDYCPYKAICRR
jgi:hypothetical protein